MKAQATDNSNIVVLPETDDYTLCVSLRGPILKSDYEESFYKPLHEIVDKTKSFNLLINYEDGYQGWNKDAAQMSLQTIINYGKYAHRLAYVNAPDSKIAQVETIKPVFSSAEIRFFPREDLPKAIEWVKA